MSTWLKLLPLELSGMDKVEIIEPEYPVGKNDHLVGEMSDMTRRLFTLGRLLEKDANQSKLDAQYCPDKARKAELQSRANEFMVKSNIIKELMWVGIKDEFGLWNISIGVRAGFKVVTMPDSQNDDIPPFFKGLFNL